ncbi:hypothetical protein ACQ4PT_007317 [Festuca glaucescens]
MAFEQGNKEELATSFFSELLGSGVGRDHDISLEAAGLPIIDLSDLEQAFSEEEAWKAIKDMPANRAPGPDGFSWDFYQHCWPIIKRDDGVRIEVGTGDHILFWEDPWVDGLSVATLAPAVVKLVHPGIARRRTVREGLDGNAWVLDVVSQLTVDAVVQFLRLWPLVQAVQVHDDVLDSFSWKFSVSGTYSTRPTYLACFAGRTSLHAAKEVWGSFDPLKHQFFGWLAIQRRCWTSDRLQRRGLPNPSLCPLCHLAAEDIDHLLLQCPYARAVWFNLLRPLRLGDHLPHAGARLSTWWLVAAAFDPDQFPAIFQLVVPPDHVGNLAGAQRSCV